MEFVKIFKSRKFLLAILLLFVLQLFLFFYLSSGNDDEDDVRTYTVNGVKYTVESEDEENTADDFNENISAIIEQADSLSGISIFAGENSFSAQNLQKTKSDYTRVLAVLPEEFDGQFLTDFFDSNLLNAVVVICGILLIFPFLDERRMGLRCMIFACTGGRAKLMARKLSAIFFGDLLVCLIFYGGTLLVSGLRYGALSVSCLSYPVQSLELFYYLPRVLSIGQFLLLYFAFRLLVLYIISLISFCLFFCVDRLLLSAGCLGALGILFYLASRISQTHPLSFLHYCSLWYLMGDSSFFSEYRNLNVGGRAVNKDTIVLFWLFLLLILLLAVTFVFAVKRYPCRSKAKILKHKKTRVKRGGIGYIYGGFLEHLSLGGAEYVKTLFFSRGGIAILVLAAVLIFQANFGDVLYSGAQEMYIDFMEKYAGLPGDDSAKAISDLEEELEEVTGRYFAATQDYGNGEISSQEYLEEVMRYDAFENDRNFLSAIEEQTEYLSDLKSERGIDGWYINTYPYANLLKTEDSLTDILLILCVVLLCSGVFSGERQCNVSPVIRSAKNGRNVIFKKKLSMAFVLTAFCYLLSEGLTVASVIHTYGLASLNAPVQSMETLMFVPFSCSIGAFLLILYLVRGLVLLAVAAFACMLSVFCSQRIAVGASLVLCVPAALSLLGVPYMQYLSVFRALSLVPVLIQMQNVLVAAFLCLIFVAVGVISTATASKKWCHG